MSTESPRLFRAADAEPGRLAGRRVAVIGYGSQGQAQAQNLRDSGVAVVVGARPGGRGWDAAAAAGFSVRRVADAVAAADLVVLLVPDQAMRAVHEIEVAPALRPGMSLLFAHGFNVHFGEIVAPAGVDVVLAAPKGVGPMLRAEYVAGRGVPGLVAVHQDASGHALADGVAYLHALGCTRAGVYETTFGEETEADLFGEQAVLCGGVVELVQAGFDTLVAAGVRPEVAYFECFHELKLIVDLLYRGGLDLMHRSISETAGYGGATRGPRVVPAASRAAMRAVMEEIRSGAFAREWLAEQRRGGGTLAAARDAARASLLEATGRRVRRLMPWTEEGAAAGDGEG